MLWQLFEALSGRLCSSLDRGLNNNTLLPTDKELRRRFFCQEKTNFKNHDSTWNIWTTCDLTLLKEKIQTRRLNKILVMGATITCFKLSWKLSNNLHCFLGQNLIQNMSYLQYLLICNKNAAVLWNGIKRRRNLFTFNFTLYCFTM